MEIIQRLKIKNEEDVLSLIFSPDSKYLIFGENSPNINVWEIEEKRSVLKFETDSYNIPTLAISPDGFLVSGGGNDFNDKGNIIFWDINNGKIIDKIELKELKPWNREVHFSSLEFSPNHKILAAVDGGLLRLLDYPENKEFDKIELYDGAEKVAFSSDNKYLGYVSRAATGKSGIIDLENKKDIVLLEFISCTSVAFNKNENSFNFVYYGGGTDNIEPEDKGRIFSYKIENGKFKEYKTYSQSEGLFRIIYSPDYNYMASISWDSNLVKIWENNKKEVISSFCDPSEEKIVEIKHDRYKLDSQELAYSPNGKYIACSIEKNIYLWELK